MALWLFFFARCCDLVHRHFMADSRTTASSSQLVLPLLAKPGAVAAHVALWRGR